MTDLPASWQSDPTGRHDHRYWDGTRWTDHVADAGVASNDPYTEPAPAPEPEPETPASETPGGPAAAEPAAEPTAVETPSPALSWSPPTPAASREPETEAEPEAGTDDTAAVASPAPSGWSRPSEPTTPEPDGPAEASPVAGWAPAAPSTAWSNEPTTVTPAATAAESPTEVTPAVDHSPLPSLSSPTGVGPSGGEPPEPIPPIGTDSSGGSDSTRRNVLIGVGILVVVAIVAFLALSGDDDDSGSSAISSRLADSLQEDAGLSNDEADCVADHIVDEVGADRLADVDFDTATPTGDLGSDYLEAYADAANECEVGAGSTDSDDDDGDAPGSSTDGEVSIPDIGDLDSFRELLADQYEQTLGLPRDKAECLGDAMAEAVSGGELDQQDAFGDFFEYLDGCDISLSEITGANP